MRIPVRPEEMQQREPVDQETILENVHDSVIKLWEIVDNLAMIRPPHPKFYYVSIFGSSRILPETDEYNTVKELASRLVRMGCRIVTGGGPGLMQAANEGAIEASPDMDETTLGLRIVLPFEEGSNTFVGKLYTHKTFFSRLHHFVMGSSAFIVVPGGVGTLLEASMIWQLLQVRHLYDTPLVMIGDMWPKLVDWAREYMVMRDPQLADPEDMFIPKCVNNLDEALAIIQADYKEWEAEGKKREKNGTRRHGDAATRGKD